MSRRGFSKSLKGIDTRVLVVESVITSSIGGSSVDRILTADDAENAITGGGISSTTNITAETINATSGTFESIRINDSGTGTANIASADADEFVISSNAIGGLTVFSADNNLGVLYFGDTTDNNVGRVVYDHTTDTLSLYANNTEQILIGSDITLNDSTIVNGDLNVTGSISGGTIGGPILITPTGTAGAPAYSFSGDADTGMFRDAANEIVFSTGATEAIRIDGNQDIYITGTIQGGGTESLPAFKVGAADTGMYEGEIGNDIAFSCGGTMAMHISNNRCLVMGYNESIGDVPHFTGSTPGFLGARINCIGNTPSSSGLQSSCFTSDYRDGPNVTFYRIRGTTVGSYASVIPSDAIGSLYFTGEGTITSNNTNVPASITGYVDGTVVANATPGRIVFSTNNGGAITEAMRINSSQNVTMAGNLTVAGSISGGTVGGPILISPTGTPGAPAYSFSGNATTGIYQTSSNQIQFSTNGTYAMRVDGTQRLVVGGNSSQIGASHNLIQAHTTHSGSSAMSICNWLGSTTLTMGKSNSGTVGSFSALSQSDTVGVISWAGDDGTDIVTIGAQLFTYVDGTVSSNVIPMAVQINTANASGTLTKAMQIDKNQNVKANKYQFMNITDSLTRTGWESSDNAAVSYYHKGTRVQLYSSDGTVLLGVARDGGAATTNQLLCSGRGLHIAPSFNSSVTPSMIRNVGKAMVIEDTWGGITLISSTTTQGGLLYADTTSGARAGVVYDHNNDILYQTVQADNGNKLIMNFGFGIGASAGEVAVAEPDTAPARQTCFRLYANGTGTPSSANTTMTVFEASDTSRSINAAGTVNQSGADYAEYFTKEDSALIKKGDICGITSDSLLTTQYSRAIHFVIKSTKPGLVGNDTWGTITQASDETKESFENRLEERRSKVDRISMCGQVPVNVESPVVGAYIIPIQSGSDTIVPTSVSSPTLNEYMSAVGKVIKVTSPNTALCLVKII